MTGFKKCENWFPTTGEPEFGDPREFSKLSNSSREKNLSSNDSDDDDPFAESKISPYTTKFSYEDIFFTERNNDKGFAPKAARKNRRDAKNGDSGLIDDQFTASNRPSLARVQSSNSLRSEAHSEKSSFQMKPVRRTSIGAGSTDTTQPFRQCAMMPIRRGLVGQGDGGSDVVEVQQRRRGSLNNSDIRVGLDSASKPRSSALGALGFGSEHSAPDDGFTVTRQNSKTRLDDFGARSLNSRQGESVDGRRVNSRNGGSPNARRSGSANRSLRNSRDELGGGSTHSKREISQGRLRNSKNSSDSLSLGGGSLHSRRDGSLRRRSAKNATDSLGGGSMHSSRDRSSRRRSSKSSTDSIGGGSIRRDGSPRRRSSKNGTDVLGGDSVQTSRADSQPRRRNSNNSRSGLEGGSAHSNGDDEIDATLRQLYPRNIRDDGGSPHPKQSGSKPCPFRDELGSGSFHSSRDGSQLRKSNAPDELGSGSSNLNDLVEAGQVRPINSRNGLDGLGGGSLHSRRSRSAHHPLKNGRDELGGGSMRSIRDGSQSGQRTAKITMDGLGGGSLHRGSTRSPSKNSRTLLGGGSMDSSLDESQRRERNSKNEDMDDLLNSSFFAESFCLGESDSPPSKSDMVDGKTNRSQGSEGKKNERKESKKIIGNEGTDAVSSEKRQRRKLQKRESA